MLHTAARNATTIGGRFLFFVVLFFTIIVHFFNALPNDLGRSSLLAASKTASAFVNKNSTTNLTEEETHCDRGDESSPQASSFCDQNDLPLRRTEMRDVICSNGGMLIPDAARSNIVFLHVLKTGLEKVLKLP
jgi:hypothetical protein